MFTVYRKNSTHSVNIRKRSKEYKVSGWLRTPSTSTPAPESATFLWRTSGIPTSMREEHSLCVSVRSASSKHRTFQPLHHMHTVLLLMVPPCNSTLSLVNLVSIHSLHLMLHLQRSLALLWTHLKNGDDLNFYEISLTVGTLPCFLIIALINWLILLLCTYMYIRIWISLESMEFDW